MIARNGIQLAAKHTNVSSSITARGFFELLFRWSRVGCSVTRRNISTSIHTGKPRRSWFPHLNTTAAAHRRQRSSIRNSSTAATQKDEPPLSISLRTLMRTLPHSVVVLTTTASAASPPSVPTTSAKSSPNTQPSSQFRGMTLSSFTTLTLTPSPIITFNIKRPSRTLEAISQSRHFLIHVLEGTENGALLAERFTRGNIGAGIKDLFLGKEGMFEVRSVRMGDLELPRLRAEGVVRVLRCEVLGDGNGGENGEDGGVGGLVSVGDHVLVLGKVHEILEDGEGERMGNGDGKHGLCYADGRYRRIGDAIEIGRGGGR